MSPPLLRSHTQNPRLLDEGTTERPDYQRCIAISTRAALKYMVPPGALVMLAPLVAGTFFGVMAVCGLLTGKDFFFGGGGGKVSLELRL